MAGKAIGVRAVQSLLKSGRSAVLKGFRSKAGKTFDARLKLDGGEVRFDFGGQDRHTGPATAPDAV
jgi:DNA topoisomerase-3